MCSAIERCLSNSLTLSSIEAFLVALESSRPKDAKDESYNKLLSIVAIVLESLIDCNHIELSESEIQYNKMCETLKSQGFSQEIIDSMLKKPIVTRMSVESKLEKAFIEIQNTIPTKVKTSNKAKKSGVGGGEKRISVPNLEYWIDQFNNEGIEFTKQTLIDDIINNDDVEIRTKQRVLYQLHENLYLLHKKFSQEDGQTYYIGKGEQLNKTCSDRWFSGYKKHLGHKGELSELFWTLDEICKALNNGVEFNL